MVKFRAWTLKFLQVVSHLIDLRSEEETIRKLGSVSTDDSRNIIKDFIKF